MMAVIISVAIMVVQLNMKAEMATRWQRELAPPAEQTQTTKGLFMRWAAGRPTGQLDGHSPVT